MYLHLITYVQHIPTFLIQIMSNFTICYAHCFNYSYFFSVCKVNLFPFQTVPAAD